MRRLTPKYYAYVSTRLTVDRKPARTAAPTVACGSPIPSPANGLALSREPRERFRDLALRGARVVGCSAC